MGLRPAPHRLPLREPPQPGFGGRKKLNPHHCPSSVQAIQTSSWDSGHQFQQTPCRDDNLTGGQLPPAQQLEIPENPRPKLERTPSTPTQSPNGKLQRARRELERETWTLSPTPRDAGTR